MTAESQSRDLTNSENTQVSPSELMSQMGQFFFVLGILPNVHSA